MKRVAEKVKDLVEICPFTYLHDFAADPGQTLGGYHFTDITADLMAKWIDRVAVVRPGNGSASALAGFRGVGKSHFLSVLGAMITRPDLRSRITDPHVASSAERLPRRHGNVASVRRGSGSTLLDELKRALAPILGVSPNTLGDSLYELMLSASEQVGDAPLVILIDTALGRDARVTRDDGPLLSEVAEAAKALGIFVGVALDDDISGADGPNASISRSYSIDYLDQEHLFKIVDSVIFAKQNQNRDVIHQIYQDYRTEFPGFRWSEHRFASLYPLHPATVEIAPIVRLYVQEFALLGFAAESGVKILGRPANSLIGLDEIFDSVETKLRSVPELTDTFAAFDRLEREVIARSPVLLRHPSRLILKGLLILSLNGEGATSDDLSAAMMISQDPAGGLDVPAILESFAEAEPSAIDRHVAGAGPQFCFRRTSQVDMDAAITAAIANVPDSIPMDLLLAQAVEKWSDIDRGSYVSPCTIDWRGSIRRGELLWPPDDDSQREERVGKDVPDWTISVEPGDAEAEPVDESSRIHWRLARLTEDERQTLKRHFVLQNDPSVREDLGDGLAAAVHMSSIAVEKIWQRVFLGDAYISAGGRAYNFTPDASAAHSVAQVLSDSLAPVFDEAFPDHPVFESTLGMRESSILVSTFLSGTGSNNTEAISLAERFAVPLGIAIPHSGAVVPLGPESLLELPVVKAALNGADGTELLPLKEISPRLIAEPFGFTREAQHLILAALVAQKEFEFITSNGNRINHRSLDLQIIWDDIVGISRPLNEAFSAERLLIWARLITGNSALRSIDRAEDRLLIKDSLAGWLSGWEQSRALPDFDALPDENLNASIWRTAANLRKSFGAMAGIIESTAKDDLSLDQSLQMIADVFSDSEDEFARKKSDLRVLREFTANVTKRDEISRYLSLCENTQDDALEASRLALIDAIEKRRFDWSEIGDADLLEVWENFKAIYSAHYAEQHDIVTKGASADRLKALIRSEAWSVFEGLSSISWLDGRYFARAKAQIRELRQLHCDSQVRDILVERPFCGCSFSLTEASRLGRLADDLESTVAAGNAAHRDAILANPGALLTGADSDAMRGSLTTLLDKLRESETPALSTQELRILRISAEKSPSPRSSATSTLAEEDEPDDFPSMWDNTVQEIEDFVNTEI